MSPGDHLSQFPHGLWDRDMAELGKEASGSQRWSMCWILRTYVLREVLHRGTIPVSPRPAPDRRPTRCTVITGCPWCLVALTCLPGLWQDEASHMVCSLLPGMQEPIHGGDTGTPGKHSSIPSQRAAKDNKGSQPAHTLHAARWLWPGHLPHPNFLCPLNSPS